MSKNAATHYVKTTATGILLCFLMAISSVGATFESLPPAIAIPPTLAQIDDVSGWAKVVTDVGILASLVLFFTLTSWKREERLASRITTLENFATHELVGCTRNATLAINDSTKAVAQLVDTLRIRPCVLDHDEFRQKIDAVVAEIKTSALRPRAK